MILGSSLRVDRWSFGRIFRIWILGGFWVDFGPIFWPLFWCLRRAVFRLPRALFLIALSGENPCASQPPKCPRIGLAIWRDRAIWMDPHLEVRWTPKTVPTSFVRWSPFGTPQLALSSVKPRSSAGSPRPPGAGVFRLTTCRWARPSRAGARPPWADLSLPRGNDPRTIEIYTPTGYISLYT